MPDLRLGKSYSLAIPEITAPSPLNRTLTVRGDPPSFSFIQSLANMPGGVHFRSIAMFATGGTAHPLLVLLPPPSEEFPRSDWTVSF